MHDNPDLENPSPSLEKRQFGPEINDFDITKIIAHYATKFGNRTFAT